MSSCENYNCKPWLKIELWIKGKWSQILFLIEIQIIPVLSNHNAIRSSRFRSTLVDLEIIVNKFYRLWCLKFKTTFLLSHCQIFICCSFWVFASSRYNHLLNSIMRRMPVMCVGLYIVPSKILFIAYVHIIVISQNLTWFHALYVIVLYRLMLKTEHNDMAMLLPQKTVPGKVDLLTM